MQFHSHLDMEIDLYKDLAAFNQLTPEEQEFEAERIRAALSASNGDGVVVLEPVPAIEPVQETILVAPEVVPVSATAPVAVSTPAPMRVVVAVERVPVPVPASNPAPAPVFFAFVDSPGSVILRAEDILPDDEPEPEPKQMPEEKLELRLGPEREPQPERKPIETTGRRVKMNDRVNPSGPLIDIGAANTKPNGTLVVCPTCGSQSEGLDLFCIVCGSFLNEPDVEVEVEAGPACVDCGASIEPGEIFCPSCGSALPG